MRGIVSPQWGTSQETVVLMPIVLDYDNKGRLVGVEIPDLFTRAFLELPEIHKPKASMLNFLKTIFGGTTYDKVADAAYMKTKRGRPAKQVEVERPVVLDLDKKGRIIGIEVLGVRRRVSGRSD